MAKKGRLRKLEGRVIESAIIRYGDPDASQPEDIGPSFELRVSGGYVFTFLAQIQPTAVQAEVTMGRDEKGNLEDLWRAIVTDKGAEEQINWRGN